MPKIKKETKLGFLKINHRKRVIIILDFKITENK